MTPVEVYALSGGEYTAFHDVMTEYAREQARQARAAKRRSG